MKSEMDKEALRALLDDIEKADGLVSYVEEQIDIKTQMEYFEISEQLRDTAIAAESVHVDELESIINDSGQEKFARTRALVMLASSGQIKALRVLERFLETAPDELRDWAILSKQEAKMHIEGELLQKKQIMISSGLGSKHGSLRFFVVLFCNSTDGFLPFQMSTLKNEFEMTLKANRSEVETINFSDLWCKALVLIPLTIHPYEVVRQVVEQCNVFGDFLRPSMIVTNVKMLDDKEIDELLYEDSEGDEQAEDDEAQDSGEKPV